MKKFVMVMAIMVMVLIYAVAIAESTTDLMPEICLNDLDTVWGDDYDLHINMYMSIPEYDYVRFEMNVKFNDNDWQNFNEGVASLYDGNTGELIDQITGNLTSEIDCSSRNTETVRSIMMDYLQNYDFEYEAEKGIRYYKICF